MISEFVFVLFENTSKTVLTVRVSLFPRTSFRLCFFEGFASSNPFQKLSRTVRTDLDVSAPLYEHPVSEGERPRSRRVLGASLDPWPENAPRRLSPPVATDLGIIFRSFFAHFAPMQKACVGSQRPRSQRISGSRFGPFSALPPRGSGSYSPRSRRIF